MVNLFDFFTIISTKPKSEYDKIPDKEKVSFAFMLNRYMSAEYPITAHEFNKRGVFDIHVVNYWRSCLIKKRYSRTPSFFFLKTSSKHEYGQDSDKLKEFDKDLIKFICYDCDIQKESIEYCLTIFPQESLKCIKEYQKILNKN